MRLINKFQEGAAFPYTQMSTTGMFSVLPTPATSGSSSTTAASKKDDDFKLLDQSVINEVIKNGLPNEVNHFLNTLQSIENSSPFTKDLNRSQLIALAKEAAHIIHNKKQYEEDIKSMVKNESASDYALNSHGGLYVQNEQGKIKSISLKEYDENRDKYIPLTYGQIAQSRAYGDQTAFDSTMLSSMREGMGTKKIAEKIKTLVKALGNKEVSEQEYQTAMEVMGTHLKQPTHAQQRGLQELAYAFTELGDDALFSVLNEQSSPDMQAAMQYIINSLGADEKKALQAKAFIERDGSTTPEAMIAHALGAFTEQKQKYSEKTSSTTNSKVNASAQLKASESYYQTAPEALFAGTVNREEMTFTNSDFKNGYAIKLQGSVMGQLSDDKNKVYERGPLRYRLEESGFSKYCDTSKVYYGNKEISAEALDKIMYDGGSVGRVWVPTDGHGNIDWNTFLTTHQMMTKLNENPQFQQLDKAQQILKTNEIFRAYNIPVQVDNEGNMLHRGQKMEPYILMYGYAKDDQLTKGNSYVKDIVGKDKDAILDTMERIYEGLGLKDPNGFFNYSDLTIAPILIRQSKFASMDSKIFSHHGPRTSYQTAEQLAMKQQITQNPHIPINAGSAQLFAE